MNNKGMTTVEVLISFILVAAVTVSMYSVISSFNDKKNEESYRTKIITYKNQITKIIQDDIIKKELESVQIEEEKTADGTNITVGTFSFRKGENKQLKIYRRYTKTPHHTEGTEYDDYFMIEYGLLGNLEQYPLPNLGETKGKYIESSNTFATEECKETPSTDCKISYDLQINSALIYITDANINGTTNGQVLTIEIGFYHPELGNKYDIKIVAPINYPNSTVKGQAPLDITPPTLN